MQSRLYLDIETASEVDLTARGYHLYSEHESTHILCAAWAVDDSEICSWSIRDNSPPTALFDAIAQCDTWESHNAAFEYALFKSCASRISWPELPFDKMRCSMIKSQYWSLPGALDAVARVLNLANKKDKAGEALLKITGAPDDDGKFFYEHPNALMFKLPDHPDKLAPGQLLSLLIEYCKQDVRTERSLSEALLDIPDRELATWRIDQNLNNRGITVDVAMAQAATHLVGESIAVCNERLEKITYGFCSKVTQVKKLLGYCKLNGYPYDTMQAADVQIAIDKCNEHKLHMHHTAKEALELRQQGCKTPLSKYAKALTLVNDQNVMRGNLRFCGAITKRWTGSGFQFQNMPRPSEGFFDRDSIDAAAEAIKYYDYDSFAAQYPDPTTALTSMIRSLIVARPGHTFMCADFSQIEARVNAWMADDHEALNLFRRGDDPYIALAKDIYNLDDDGWQATDKDKRSTMRDMGKRGELGLGYGMGGGTFKYTLRMQAHKDYPLDFCQRVVDAYRLKHEPIRNSWYDYLNAATTAVSLRLPPEQAVSAHGVKFYMGAKKGVISFLIMELRSGGRIYFANPSIRMEYSPWAEPDPDTGEYNPDDKVETLCYEGKHPKTKKWARLPTHGGMFCGIICQATARDLMVHGLHNVVKAGYDPILLVHDEILSENPIGKGALDAYIEAITDAPAWAAGIPIKAEGWIGDRYMKG